MSDFIRSGTGTDTLSLSEHAFSIRKSFIVYKKVNLSQAQTEYRVCAFDVMIGLLALNSQSDWSRRQWNPNKRGLGGTREKKWRFSDIPNITKRVVYSI